MRKAEFTMSYMLMSPRHLFRRAQLKNERQLNPALKECPHCEEANINLYATHCQKCAKTERQRRNSFLHCMIIDSFLSIPRTLGLWPKAPSIIDNVTWGPNGEDIIASGVEGLLPPEDWNTVSGVCCMSGCSRPHILGRNACQVHCDEYNQPQRVVDGVALCTAANCDNPAWIFDGANRGELITARHCVQHNSHAAETVRTGYMRVAEIGGEAIMPLRPLRRNQFGHEICELSQCTGTAMPGYRRCNAHQRLSESEHIQPHVVNTNVAIGRPLTPEEARIVQAAVETMDSGYIKAVRPPDESPPQIVMAALTCSICLKGYTKLIIKGKKLPHICDDCCPCESCRIAKAAKEPRQPDNRRNISLDD